MKSVVRKNGGDGGNMRFPPNPIIKWSKRAPSTQINFGIDFYVLLDNTKYDF